MKKSLLEIYALAVCLITLVWSVVVSAIAIYGLVRIAAPDLTVEAYNVGRYRTNDSYVESVQNNRSGEAAAKMSDDEVSRRRASGLKEAIDEERRSGTRDFIRNMIALSINALVFFLHWRLALRARASSPS